MRRPSPCGVSVGCSVLALLASLVGCHGSSSSTPSPGNPVRATPRPTPTHLEAGDLPAIKGHGLLRILIPRQSATDDYLPRQGFPRDVEREELEQFAREQGLAPVWVYVASHDDLIPSLLAGKGDVIAAQMTITPERKAQIGFSEPIGLVREQLVCRLGDKKVHRPANLQGRKVALRKSASFFQTIEELRKDYPKIQEEIVPETVETEEILDGVGTGKYDVAAADSDLVEAVMTYRDDLRVAFDLTGDHPLAWGIRPDSSALKKALDTFLDEEQLARKEDTAYQEDLPGIEKRKVLRVLTRNSAATYFLWKGEVLGFEYELAKAFANRHGLRLEVVVPPTREDLIPWLKAGRADLIAAALTPTEERKAAGLGFTRAYDSASEELVTRPNDTALKTVQDLKGRTVVVRKSSSYWQTLAALKTSGGIGFKLVAAPEEMETEEIIGKVGSGDFDLTVADSDILDIELTWRDDVTAAFPLGDPQPHAWAVRGEDKQLLAALDSYLKTQYRSAEYNLAYRKYFKDPRAIKSAREFASSHPGELSPYDLFLRKYGKQFNIDWRLLAAQMFQESRFDPEARSWVGAVGLMQVMPMTGKELGFDDIRDPETGIAAGVTYLCSLRDEFDSELSVEDRMWFALASYNAGIGHVIDARRLADKKGLDRNRWFGNVETTILLLSKPEVARAARFGYCRGKEPADYVRLIRDRFENYKKTTEQAAAGP